MKTSQVRTKGSGTTLLVLGLVIALLLVIDRQNLGGALPFLHIAVAMVVTTAIAIGHLGG